MNQKNKYTHYVSMQIIMISRFCIEIHANYRKDIYA